MLKRCIIAPFVTANKYRYVEPESLPENQFYIDLNCTSSSLTEFYSKRGLSFAEPDVISILYGDDISIQHNIILSSPFTLVICATKEDYALVNESLVAIPIVNDKQTLLLFIDRKDIDL